MKNFKVALSPIKIEFGNLSRNRNTILKSIRIAAKAKADIICLPEYCITGYNYSKDKKSSDLAEQLKGEKFIEKLRKLSGSSDIDIILGVLERLGDKIYNTGLYISGGRILLKHHKVREAGPITPGNRVNVVNSRFGKIAIIICGDLFTKKVRVMLKEAKPDFVFMPMDRCLHEFALCRNYRNTCEKKNCRKENQINNCYKKGFQRYKDVWTTRVKMEYANEIRKYSATTFIVNGLSSKGHRLACGGALHIDSDGKIVNEIPYGKCGVKIIEIRAAHTGDDRIQDHKG